MVRGYARPRKFSRTGDFGAGHVTFKVVPRFPGSLVPVCASDVEPHVRAHGIFEDAPAQGVHEPEGSLSISISLGGGAADPAGSFGVVLGSMATRSGTFARPPE